ncbi:hypothetical protein, partial [Mycobacteroides abscessus]
WRLFLRHTCILVSKVRSLRDFQGDSSLMTRGVRMSDWLATDYRRLSDPGPAVPDWFWVDDEYDEKGNPR